MVKLFKTILIISYHGIYKGNVLSNGFITLSILFKVT
jgi:hypothetical protein